MTYVVEIDNQNVIDNFRKAINENGENETEIITRLMQEYIEDLQDLKDLNEAIKKDDNDFMDFKKFVAELEAKNEI